ncbi:uncharacterized protein C6G9.01c [Vicia villosa]|uniref:uncharacterized protein C6G9.01c n=1 Tax=Vicia villosa TaxID=3911 RepID=UPI00273CC106|nr:uncharacterized protein C6G9.01c [Vicia villosa]XP_058735462.1 uncharacterized protein C6G9.01c [Vicia villosa]XP_058735463.1 uncharacterized protein C6G9.01c [Vicia villosa]
MTKKTKKGSTITSNKLQENNTIEEEQKPSSLPKKAVSEIDEIFAGKKRKKPDVKKGGKADQANQATKSSDKTKKRTNEKKKTKRADEDEFIERSSRSRKKTADGLTIYTEEELGLSKGDAGNTPLCPFDCSCCF